MILKNPPLHHVGIVQPEEEIAESLMALLGVRESYRGSVEAFHALCIFTEAVGHSPIEFVIPKGGALERFNKGAGGLHHIAFEVPDLIALTEDLARRDMRMLEPNPVKGAGRFLCNFLLPSATRGIIVEYVQAI
jgi:methylmalonyl-CoA/ethylmalonyl-CoA epimerase